MVSVGALGWSDVDPALHEFDPSIARHVARDMLDGLDVDLPDRLLRDQIGDELARRLFEAYGAWVGGWNWDSNGGPVRTWGDSIVAQGERDVRPTIERVVAAVAERRAFLEELATRYRELRNATAGFDLPRQAQYAAARLLAFVVETTEAYDDWYWTFTDLLGWFLESCGHGSVARDAIATVVSGHFRSWVAPADASSAAVLNGVAHAVGQAQAMEDSLAAWQLVRDDIRMGREDQTVGYVNKDAHRAFIDSHDRPRDPIRADRMLDALDACRAAAVRGEPLTFDLLASWQQLVLGSPTRPTWRTTDAFVERARYAYTPALPPRFDAILAEANSTEPAALRAVRVYLDICFFHPFVDGNARAARLALDHVLTRADLRLQAIEPLITLSRAADDAVGASTMVGMVQRLAGRA